MAPATEHLPDPNTTALLTRIAGRLARRFAGVFAAETVERYVYESYTTLLRTAKIRTYVPVLAEHFATDRLTALAQAKGAIDKHVPEILFVCVHNAGRSQMAAAPDAPSRRRAGPRPLRRVPACRRTGAHGRHQSPRAPQRDRTHLDALAVAHRRPDGRT